ncbi:MAG TPA: AraC family transcriptional regulator [Chitinophagaceae bacterium]|jgi:AraC-like DNA-binding protein
MLLQSLPTSFNPENELTPPVYPDHFLFSENLQRPYECPEHPSGLGLLTAGKGNCTYYVNGVKNQVSQYQVLFVNRSSQLAIKIAEKDTLPLLLFFNSRLPDLVQHSLLNSNEALLEETFEGLPYDFSYLERIHLNENLHQTISSLVALGSSCSSFASLKADIIIRNLFENLLKDNQDAFRLSQNIHAIKASTRLEIFKRVSQARDWMEENYQRAITLEDIAVGAAMNSQHFLRMFKQIYHITPHQYLVDLKLKKAKQLLESTPLSITEICYSIGFESVFSFSILFKKRFGLAPSHFRGE